MWYNVDITKDRNRIKKGVKPKWLLKSDKEFQRWGEHIPEEGCFVEKCNISMPQKQIEDAILACNKRETKNGKTNDITRSL